MKIIFVKPYTCITISLNEFFKKFVGEMEFGNRHAIFNQYKSFVESLNEIAGKAAFYQWIDGSFINLNSFPNDLDVVTFLPEQTYKSIEKNLKLLYLDKEKFSLPDTYFVKVLPSNHTNFFLYQSDRSYWYHLFSYSKRNLASGKRFEKGFFKLTLTYEPRRKK